MKNKKLLLGIIGLGLVITVVLSSVIGKDGKRQYNPVKSEFNQGISGAVQWLASIRNNQVTGELNPIDVLNSRKEIAQLINSKALGLQWLDLGPNNIGGRVRAILVDRSNSNLLYAGGVSGGLFKSTTGGTSWVPLPGMTDVIIGSIAQNPLNGNLYVGTGESFANIGNVGGTPGFLGSGLYESTDGGQTWNIFHGAAPTSTNTTTIDWAFVNRIAVDPVNGRVYAATNRGLRSWDGISNRWVKLITGTTPNIDYNTSVVVGSDRTVVFSINNVVYVSPGVTGNGDSATFIQKSAYSGVARVEIAIAPSNPDYIYTCVAKTDGSLHGVYRSTDKGNTWTVIGPGGANAFNLFGDNKQGDYDNCIAVSPSNPNNVFVGGINLWEWNLGSSFTQITINVSSVAYNYIHADLHTIVFDPNNPNTFYVGSDGGVSKTINNGQTFSTINKNLNLTQFYAMAMDGSTGIMGGTQDNSNPYIAGIVNSSDPSLQKKAIVLEGGDGGWAAFSLINPKAFFGTLYYAGTWRSPDKGVTFNSAMDKKFFSMTMLGNPADDAAGPAGREPSYAPFVTSLLLWESFSDYNSPFATYFVDDSLDHVVGENITVRSQNNRYPFNYVITPSDGDLDVNDTLWVQDIITSKFFVGLNSGIWMTFGPLQFSYTPQWHHIASISQPHTMSISKDGNYLFVGTISGALYRISNILAITDSVSAWHTSPFCVIETKLLRNFGQAVTSIAIDPKNPERILVTLGNYGNTSYVYYSDNALHVNPTFTSKQGTTTGLKLPAMPIYSAIFEMENPNTVLLGTEYGIYATEDITQSAAQITWTEENNGMARVPVFMIRQQIYNYPGVSNLGGVYIGTHGKGFYWTNKWVGINENETAKETNGNKLLIYPNPVNVIVNIGYSLSQKSGITIKIYDLNGRVIKMVNLLNKPIGYHTEIINCSDLKKGTYIVQLLEGNNSKTSKFVVTK